MNKKIAIIVGRFQSAEYHQGYYNLMEEANKYEKVLVFLGVSPRKVCTKTDPLPYEVRVRVFENELLNTNNGFEEDKYLFSPVYDNSCDIEWSKALDVLIQNQLDELNLTDNFRFEDVEFLVSKDSFISHYHGKVREWKNIEVHTDILNGKIEASNSSLDRTNVLSDIENHLSCYLDEEITQLATGMIYATQKQYDRVDPTVDIIPYVDLEDEVYIMLGRKQSDPDGKYRLCGGFVDTTDDTYEHAAIRELIEEMNIIAPIENMKYICNKKINDWRYRKGNDKIHTTLFAYEVKDFNQIFSAKAGDDLSEIKMFKFRDVYSILMDEHKSLFDSFLKYLGL